MPHDLIKIKLEYNVIILRCKQNETRNDDNNEDISAVLKRHIIFLLFRLLLPLSLSLELQSLADTCYCDSCSFFLAFPITLGCDGGVRVYSIRARRTARDSESKAALSIENGCHKFTWYLVGLLPCVVLYPHSDHFFLLLYISWKYYLFIYLYLSLDTTLQILYKYVRLFFSFSFCSNRKTKLSIFSFHHYVWYLR